MLANIMSFSTTELSMLTDAEVLARSQKAPDLFAIVVKLVGAEGALVLVVGAVDRFGLPCWRRC